MIETVKPRNRIARLAGIVAAILLTAISTMRHGSRLEARLLGPQLMDGLGHARSAARDAAGPRLYRRPRCIADGRL